MMEEEAFEIKPCPLCGGSHLYTLEIKLSDYLYGRSKSTASHLRKWTRLFTCPIKDEFFEAEMELMEDARGSIEQVKVTGIIAEEPNGTKKTTK